eukprot:CAMPEP_0177735504 /NCGR_PEP_ID=MMETSP0484_2-20121128/24812_1 /TAXON_ID=354590 /ORGANISM="Rhodomonas lens, Strain RHODO" /LENGTH=61 /DNA_ID=CAMNT_0019249073 /DNA_START=26 /DNA_END=208 /DNA_ORIENTATION=+
MDEDLVPGHALAHEDGEGEEEPEIRFEQPQLHHLLVLPAGRVAGGEAQHTRDAHHCPHNHK